jgi:hypothetical protein
MAIQKIIFYVYSIIPWSSTYVVTVPVYYTQKKRFKNPGLDKTGRTKWNAIYTES